MSGLRAFLEGVFGLSPSNPVAAPPVLRVVRERETEERELLELILAHLREGHRDDMATDPAYFDRKAVLFARMSTAELRRSWDATDAQQARYHMRLSVRAAETAQTARRRARELRAIESTRSVWRDAP